MQQRITRTYKAIAILSLNALVIAGGAELIARGAVTAWTSIGAKEEPRDARQLSSYYRDKSWAHQYWDEYARSEKQQYHAFTVWRRAAFRGQTINIDSDGIRITPGSDCSRGAFRVFTFGSSTMWGTGAPDWGTIPAYLEAGLKRNRQGPICVTNFGESGYVSTQSVIALMLQIQAGNIPNLAIFFDGASDIYAGYQSGRAGAIHENFELTAARVERRDLPTSPLVIQALKSTSLFRLADSQVSKLSATQGTGAKAVTYETMKIDRTALADSIADTYLNNYHTVDGLARRYGFAFYYFWPPTLSKGKKPLTGEEIVLTRRTDPALHRLVDAVYATMDARIGPQYQNLFSITDLFDQCTSLIWLDDNHTTPVGNKMIAERMLRAMTETGPSLSSN
jgi:lysophospholipase L1-like esterase